MWLQNTKMRYSKVKSLLSQQTRHWLTDLWWLQIHGAQRELPILAAVSLDAHCDLSVPPRFVCHAAELGATC